MAQSFDESLFPPAPVLDVRLAFPQESAKMEAIKALVDTGSDFTMMPLDELLAINAPESRTAFVRGLFSERQMVTLYFVDVHLDIGMIGGVEVIGVEDNGAILGRNILNRLYLYLDGVAQQTHIFERPPQRL